MDSSSCGLFTIAYVIDITFRIDLENIILVILYMAIRNNCACQIRKMGMNNEIIHNVAYDNHNDFQ
jgi:hypothetical protein